MTNKDERGYVKFTGDYSKLKSMGFTFQKLYANNYMQWERRSFRVWKKGHDIVHDDYNLFRLIKFLRTNPRLRTHTYPNGDVSHSFYKMYYGDEFNAYNYDYHAPSKEIVQKFQDYYKACNDRSDDEPFPEPIGDMVFITPELLKDLQELKDLGWYELAYFSED